jgi:hypothetical protein
MTAPYLLKKCLKIPQGAIRRRKSKDNHYKSQKKKEKRTNNDPLNITQKPKDPEKLNSLKTWDELGCSGRISSSCSRCGTCLDTIMPIYKGPTI